uniref:Uncharacterized protein n=1 Tax=Anguilla anguilla TaxID=7936 RepID=A0A0E9QWE3_ANGAN
MYDCKVNKYIDVSLVSSRLT